MPWSCKVEEVLWLRQIDYWHTSSPRPRDKSTGLHTFDIPPTQFNEELLYWLEVIEKREQVAHEQERTSQVAVHQSANNQWWIGAAARMQKEMTDHFSSRHTPPKGHCRPHRHHWFGSAAVVGHTTIWVPPSTDLARKLLFGPCSPTMAYISFYCRDPLGHHFGHRSPVIAQGWQWLETVEATIVNMKVTIGSLVTTATVTCGKLIRKPITSSAMTAAAVCYLRF